MSCPLCANNIDKQLLRVSGVNRVKVNLDTGEVFVSMSASSPPSSEQLSHAITQSGFTLARIDMPGEKDGH